MVAGGGMGEGEREAGGPGPQHDGWLRVGTVGTPNEAVNTRTYAGDNMA